MTWSSFTSLVVIGYALYYGINIFFDLLRSTKQAGAIVTDALVFEEPSEPTPVSTEGFLVMDAPTADSNPEADLTGPEANKSIDKEYAQNAKNQNESEDGIGLTRIETVRQSPISGGVSYIDLFRLCREKAIVESTKFNFAN